MENRGRLNYSEASASQNLSAEVFNRLPGAKIERVPYKASRQPWASGRAQVMFPDLPQALTQIEDGRMRGLDALAPDVGSDTAWWTRSITAAGIEPE